MMKVIEILSSQKDHSPRNTNSKFAPEKMLGLEDELRFLLGGVSTYVEVLWLLVSVSSW